ncbi:hypothetical protein [Pseudomonas japonica]|uniref:hypothetical protein n=1 Tax=Pseudomonas japonica TaxID=256466 RepID=UPI001131D2C6|nr:hypothetical protein [Pseudomonas japonica]
MRRIQKITQQRRRQLHVHIAPSGLQEMPQGEGSSRTRPASVREVSEAAGRRPAFEGSTWD